MAIVPVGLGEIDDEGRNYFKVEIPYESDSCKSE